MCDKELCTFRYSLDALNAANAQVVGVSIDLPFTARVFAERYELSFPLLSDYNRSVIRQYGLICPNFAGLPDLDSTMRAVILLDGGGIIRYLEVTANPGVEPDYTALLNAAAAL